VLNRLNDLLIYQRSAESEYMRANIMIDDTRKMFNRPVIVSLGFTVLGELFLLVIHGIILFPDGNIFYKALWAIVFCGIGMGATLGAFINLIVTGRYSGIKAVIFTILLSFFLLGMLCELLCFKLDLTFHYFGASTNPTLFLLNGMVGSIIAGAGIGELLFSRRGNSVLMGFGV
jgi:hypothetical protein